MERYDYREAMLEDIREALQDDYYRTLIDGLDKEEAFDKLYDELWTDDSVTGNGSGSYTFSAWEAEENICHNVGLLEEACNEFGCDVSDLQRGAEYADVTIRCYLLSGCLADVLDEIYDE